MSLRAPFSWFGGKSTIASMVWSAFGDCGNYIEPFAGSLAVLLQRPTSPKIETVNDINCYLSNFWRATQHAPDEVAKYSDWPVNEVDLHARHGWLIEQPEFRQRMLNDPDYFDAKIAGWWVWGLSQWIGASWCEEKVIKKRPRLSGFSPGGIGVHKHWDQFDMGASRGVNAQRIGNIYDYFRVLSERLRRVRVLCGDWKRVLSRAVTTNCGISTVCGLFLDPPYAHDHRTNDLYGASDDGSISAQVREWASANGDNPQLRIALCGYEGEHNMPNSWRCEPWKAHGGYSNRNKNNKNRFRERVWFSPHCLKPSQLALGVG